jgi:hypothetical protein|tara:strand:- start:709 stop:1026 length:318 start_codon:yes stop_codon:yes gene_type:complete
MSGARFVVGANNARNRDGYVKRFQDVCHYVTDFLRKIFVMVRSIGTSVKGLIPCKPFASKDLPVIELICRRQAWLCKSQTSHAVRVKKPADAGFLNQSQAGAMRL